MTAVTSISETMFPTWVPDAAKRYLTHTDHGCSLRKLARRDNVSASTVLRQIRRVEAQRDDPLVDQALNALGQHPDYIGSHKETDTMSMHSRILSLPNQSDLEREARRILRRLSESDAVLAVSENMDQAVVLRMKDDIPVRTAKVDRCFAQAFALKDWIKCVRKGRVHQYAITNVGCAALKRLLSEHANPVQSDCDDSFANQHRDWGQRDVADGKGGASRSVRVNMAESPLMALSRRKGKDGSAFLSEGLVIAGERLREDFELAQMGPRLGQNWERFLTPGGRGSLGGGRGPAEGPSDARGRVQAALAELGPGLGDVVLRCCCHLEGLEAAEKRMGCSARSGKIVLRIALQRLDQHYTALHGRGRPQIG